MIFQTTNKMIQNVSSPKSSVSIKHSLRSKDQAAGAEMGFRGESFEAGLFLRWIFYIERCFHIWLRIGLTEPDRTIQRFCLGSHCFAGSTSNDSGAQPQFGPDATPSWCSWWGHLCRGRDVASLFLCSFRIAHEILYCTIWRIIERYGYCICISY